MARYHFYSRSADAWKAMLEAMKKAKHSIYWESYIVNFDSKRYNFSGVLKKKAKEGVSVKMVVDSLGSFFINKKLVQDLQKQGVEILFYNRLVPWWNPVKFKHWWLHRNHKKLLIIDNKIAFIGGVNVAKRFKDWWDLQVELKGPIVNYLVKSFAASYRLSGGRDKITYPAVFRTSKKKIFRLSPLTSKRIFQKYYKQVFQKAKKNIIIVTPYFIPQLWLIKLIKKTLKRGVKIEIILPRKTDYKIADLVNYSFASLLAQPGINFFLTKKMNHAKVVMMDNQEAAVGSHNFDISSFHYNLEIGVAFKQKDMIGSLKHLIEIWKRFSIKANFNFKNRRWHQRLIAALFLYFFS